MLAHQSAERLAKKIDRALTHPKVEIDGPTAEYLKAAKGPLEALGKMPSSKPTGHKEITRFGPIDEYGPDPKWNRAYERFKRDMAGPTATFVAIKMDLEAPANKPQAPRLGTEDRRPRHRAGG